MNKLLDKVRRKKPFTPITYPDAKSAINSFKKDLETVAETLLQNSDHKPLVIAIDELDRCRPSYAVGTAGNRQTLLLGKQHSVRAGNR